MASMIFVSSCPARPTNGMPWMSSSAPVASPTNIRSASGLPTPKTICRRPCACSLQRTQSPMSARTAVRASVDDLYNGTSAPLTCSPESAARLTPRAPESSSEPRGPPGSGVGADSEPRVRQTRSRLTPATPSSAANRRCSLSASRSTEQLLDAVENLLRDACLRLKRKRVRPGRADDRHRVRVHVETRVGPGNVVGDDEIYVLLLALHDRASYDVFGFGCKADDYRALACR